MEKTSESTSALAREAVGDLRELVRKELILARDELERDARGAVVPALASACGAMLAWAGVRLCLEASAVLEPRRAAVAGAVLSVLGVGLAVLGWRALPRRPLRETRARLEADEALLRHELAGSEVAP